MSDTIAKEIDVRGQNCPMPVLRAKVALGEVEPGELVKVLATDPFSVPDFEAFCAKTGHELVDSGEQDGIFEFIIRRRS